MVKVLQAKDLERIPRASLVAYILEGVREIEESVALNRLSEDFETIDLSEETQIHLINLIKLLTLLTEQPRVDPLSARIILNCEELLPVLAQILGYANNKTKLGKWLSENRSLRSQESITKKLAVIIDSLESWRGLMLSKMIIPSGNIHVRDTYHPQFPLTYGYLPKAVPADYHSNYFFEVHIKELNFVTTAIQLIHPFSDRQMQSQKPRLMEELVNSVVNFEFADLEQHEAIDNMRAIRMHGPQDNKDYPGSYIVVRGGVHRMREIYLRYLEGKVSGDEKILIQLVTESDFYYENGKYLSRVKEEIVEREKLRSAIINAKS